MSSIKKLQFFIYSLENMVCESYYEKAGYPNL